jgi:hypothetical protein
MTKSPALFDKASKAGFVASGSGINLVDQDASKIRLEYIYIPYVSMTLHSE